ncbi:DUF5684 domain-containing protein [Cellulomonas massiliensis]|uniref:DUF5684 domain-containing protein n=1 Tax=Cellulomonas massiliensis TaxID=1465811 RepID=UPI000314C7C2|nr:DUF5684 domain-containing protein [Cellulomonas massiliensis]
MQTLLALTTDVDPTAAAAAGTGGFISGVIGYLIAAFALFGAFKKAGEPAWAAFVPVYNSIVLLKIAGKPWWWFLLALIPIVNIVVWIIVAIELSKSFGHGTGFAVGLIFLSIIFLFVLSYDGNPYVGPGGVRQQVPAAA